MDKGKFEVLVGHEEVIIYYMLNYASITPREVSIKFFERMIDLYIENNGDKQSIEKYKGYLEEFTDDSTYLKRIEAKYEVDSNRFRRDKEVITVMHDNLISVCKKLQEDDKVVYYEERKRMFLDNM